MSKQIFIIFPPPLINRNEGSKSRHQHADPHQLRQEDCDAVWNELAYFKREHKKLLIEKWVSFSNNIHMEKHAGGFLKFFFFVPWRPHRGIPDKIPKLNPLLPKTERKNISFFSPYQWQVTSLLALTETVLHDLGIVLINVALICWRCRSSLACILHTAMLHFWNEVVRG